MQKIKIRSGKFKKLHSLKIMLQNFLEYFIGNLYFKAHRMIEGGEFIDIPETWDDEKASRDEVEDMVKMFLVENFGEENILFKCGRNGFMDVFDAARNIYWRELSSIALQKFFGINSPPTQLTPGRGGNVIFKLWQKIQLIVL